MFAKEEVLKHGAPFSVWADGNQDEYPSRVVETLDDLVSAEDALGVAIAGTIPHELGLFLFHELLNGTEADWMLVEAAPLGGRGETC